MRVHALKTLKQFWQTYPDAEASLRSWYAKMESKGYANPHEVISEFKNSDYVGNERIVFNIARNKYRLIVAFNYEFGLCFVKFIGTHKDYDKVDVQNVEYKP